jgi:hypothetical protein
VSVACRSGEGSESRKEGGRREEGKLTRAVIDPELNFL